MKKATKLFVTLLVMTSGISGASVISQCGIYPNGFYKVGEKPCFPPMCTNTLCRPLILF